MNSTKVNIYNSETEKYFTKVYNTVPQARAFAEGYSIALGFEWDFSGIHNSNCLRVSYSDEYRINTVEIIKEK